MEKAYKFRIYPSKEQEQQIQRTFGSCRYVYNYFLAARQSAYQERGETLGYFACCQALTQLKKEAKWLSQVDSTALQASLKALDNAFQGFFSRVLKGVKPGYPRFKSKKRFRKSYTTKRVGTNIAFDGTHLKLPKLGWVRSKGFRAIHGRIVNATVSQAPSGKYSVSLCCVDADISKQAATGVAVGIDMGVKSLMVTSEGVTYPNHKYLARSLKKLARLQRRLSRKPKDSRRREKARIAVARLHERIANQRNDTIHKLTTSIVAEYDTICLEQLQVRKMLSKRKWARSLADASWGEARRQLNYKAKWHAKRVVEVGLFFPSSQLCSACGYQNKETID